MVDSMVRRLAHLVVILLALLLKADRHWWPAPAPAWCCRSRCRWSAPLSQCSLCRWSWRWSHTDPSPQSPSQGGLPVCKRSGRQGYTLGSAPLCPLQNSWSVEQQQQGQQQQQELQQQQVQQQLLVLKQQEEWIQLNPEGLTVVLVMRQ